MDCFGSIFQMLGCFYRDSWDIMTFWRSFFCHPKTRDKFNVFAFSPYELRSSYLLVKIFKFGSKVQRYIYDCDECNGPSVKIVIWTLPGSTFKDVLVWNFFQKRSLSHICIYTLALHLKLWHHYLVEHKRNLIRAWYAGKVKSFFFRLNKTRNLTLSES